MFSKGDKVYFGRAHGEQTLGEVVKVNRATCKVKQLESRGMYRERPVGTIWTVPVSLVAPAYKGEGQARVEIQQKTVADKATRMQKRQERYGSTNDGETRGFLMQQTPPSNGLADQVAQLRGKSEAELKQEILGIYSQLSPENLYCDGELPAYLARRKAAALNRRLKACFQVLGRSVSESEAYGYGV